MQKTCRQLIASTIITFIAIGSLNAAPAAMSTTFISADKGIKNLKPALGYVKKHSSMEVLFPQQVPNAETTTLYASYESDVSNLNYNKFWMIDVATQAGCKTKGCIIGSLTAEKNGKLDKDYLQAPFGENNKPILKDKVKLAKGLTGYYTPGHAEADWHPPKIEWQQKDVLYSITWEIKDNARDVLVKMADSAIESQK